MPTHCGKYLQEANPWKFATVETTSQTRSLRWAASQRWDLFLPRHNGPSYWAKPTLCQRKRLWAIFESSNDDDDLQRQHSSLSFKISTPVRSLNSSDKGGDEKLDQEKKSKMWSTAGPWTSLCSFGSLCRQNLVFVQDMLRASPNEAKSQVPQLDHN